MLIIWLILAVVVYGYWVKGWVDYRRARRDIFEYVKGYKRRCTGNNRFVVTVPILQNAFREYNTDVITKVWIELVKERVIEQDSQDNEWCIR
jgi:hypothetical protein